MKLLFSCKECEVTIVFNINRFKRIYNLKFDWTCNNCNKINNEYLPLLDGDK